MKKLLIVLMVFSLLGCANQALMKKETKPQKRGETEEIAYWINGLSNPEMVVGIARKSNSATKMTESAKQMAAVMMNRNNSSFVINNFATTEVENPLNARSADFKLNVGGSPRKLKQVYKRLKLVDYSIAYGYFFGLFSINGSSSIPKNQVSATTQIPDWFDENYFSESDKQLFFMAKATSLDLKTAWEKAAEITRQKFAQYLMKQVQGRVQSVNENLRSDIAMESRLMLENIVITRSEFVPRCTNGSWRYDVYFEMKMEK